MALYSMLVHHEGERFSTQVLGASAHEAVRSFFTHTVARSLSPSLGPHDIIHVTPMTDLVNLWAACAGKEGRYVNLTVVRTDEHHER